MSYTRRFWQQVDVRGYRDCWAWQGSVTAAGHGKYKGQMAHRMALFLSGVKVMPRTDVHHLCAQKLCVNPYHLQVLTHSDHSTVTRGERSGV